MPRDAPVPDRAELEAALEQRLARLATDPDRALDLEGAARLERELGIGGWEERMLQAADVVESWGVDTLDAELQAGYLRAIAGSPVGAIDLRRLIDTLLATIPDLRRAPAQDVHALVLAAFLIRDDELCIDVAQRVGTKRLGQMAAVPALSAARRARDRSALDSARATWVERCLDEPVDSTAMTPAARDMVRIIDAIEG